MAHADSEYSFAVLTIFTNTPEQQQQVADAMRVWLTAQAHLQPGVCSFELFTDESGRHIISLSRWKDRASFEAFKSSAVGIRAAEADRALTPAQYFLRPEAAGTLSRTEAGSSTV